MAVPKKKLFPFSVVAEFADAAAVVVVVVAVVLAVVQRLLS
jgi:hypothetical protein